MEKLNYKYSFKNIPIPTKPLCQLSLIKKTESVIKRMRWKADVFLNGDNKENNTKTSFGFKSRYQPPSCTELEHFENRDLINIIINVKFIHNTSSFQKNPHANLKDHKENFRSKPSCRLINPCKNEF